ncbi:hypothetical protein [Streptomyces curacoi]|uniref:Uncharacterized protein n=1 Tax=Streptomyces curacoi TaxID=146536 RepID=A0A124GWI9_9ACTN|nr:hypothetical protein [Streptomyces curacoi]KUM69935.1 hypothetical protein AQI70_30325 [Streptomyces curacoi]
MRTTLAVATGLPTILLTAALVVIVCFWLLVAAGFTTADSFDADVDLRAWGMGGVPVTVAVSSLTVLAWLLSVGGTLVLVAFTSPGPVTGLLRLMVPALALLAAWRLTRLFVRPLHRLFPDEPGLPELGPAGHRHGDHLDQAA